MSKKINPVLAIPLIAFLFMTSLMSCKGKTSDADVKTSVDNAIAANASLSGVSTSVKDGVVTLSGEVKDDAAKASAENSGRGINGVKSVRII
jgi:osmotically-inducible protein OsmY